MARNLHEFIDDLLNYVGENSFRFPHENALATNPKFSDKNMILKAFKILEEHEVIENRNGERVLTLKGREICISGGWLFNINYKEGYKKLVLKQIESNIKLNDFLKENGKNQYRVLLVTVFVAIVAAGATVIQAITSKRQLDLQQKVPSSIILNQIIPRTSPDTFSHLQNQINMMQAKLAKQDSLIKKLSDKQ